LGNIRENLFEDIQNILPDFAGCYAASVEDDVGGLAIFINKTLHVNKVNNLVLFPDYNADREDKDYFSMGRNLQVLEFSHQGKIYTILNFHGMWIPKNKTDTDKRLEQSNKVRQIFDKANGSKILCTDLNVLPDTESLSILSRDNVNLIDKYGITNTRSSLDPSHGQVVDYIVVSPEIAVNDFKVLEYEVSDHLPLVLDFD
jgi:endonuclease/exonuclease/phosphatase family metal-dependent hydrolase